MAWFGRFSGLAIPKNHAALYINLISSSENALEHCTHTFLSPESIPGTLDTSCGTNDHLFFKKASKFRENRDILDNKITGGVGWDYRDSEN